MQFILKQNYSFASFDQIYLVDNRVSLFIYFFIKLKFLGFEYKTFSHFLFEETQKLLLT